MLISLGWVILKVKYVQKIPKWGTLRKQFCVRSVRRLFAKWTPICSLWFHLGSIMGNSSLVKCLLYSTVFKDIQWSITIFFYREILEGSTKDWVIMLLWSKIYLSLWCFRYSFRKPETENFDMKCEFAHSSSSLILFCSCRLSCLLEDIKNNRSFSWNNLPCKMFTAYEINSPKPFYLPNAHPVKNGGLQMKNMRIISLYDW